MARMAKKPKSVYEMLAERRRAELEAVRQMCAELGAELGTDEAELMRRTREALDLYRQKYRKRTEGRTIQRNSPNIFREVLCGNYDPNIMPEIKRKLREALRIRAAKRASIAKLASRGLRGERGERVVEAVYKAFPPPPEKAAGPSRGEGEPE
jgi:hypothetical protein